jgi:PAS domain S-box-containing protein
MIVEDDRIVAKDLQNSLENFGFDITAIVSSGREAIEKAKEDRPDLVLMDIILKGEIDGIEAADQIRNQFNIPVVYLTAYSDAKVLERAKVTEPFGYILKPFEDRELFSVIEIALYKYKAQEALRESEEKFRSITVCAQDAILMLEHEGNIPYSNEAMEKIFGFSSQEIRGRDFHTLFVPESYRERFKKDFELFMKSGKGETVGKLFELNALKKDGTEFPVELSLSPVLVKGKWNAIGIIRDISDRKSAEEDKERLQEQLRQAQKMEAIGTLAGGIAHDFNNILSAIIGYTELSKMKLPEDSSVQTDLDEIFKAGNRAKDLVQQILTFSRQAEQELKPVMIKLIAKEAIKLFRASLPSTIEIRHDIESDSLVMGDPTQIHQVLMNLCTNAGHAMQETGGELEVELIDVELDPEFTITHPETKPGPHIQLTVRDTGHGMSSDILKRIFDPFFTTKEKGVGTGMGLSVVHGIVKSYGGTVIAYSEPGKGSTFKVFFPAIERRREPGIMAEKLIPKGTERILFVDDEQPLVDVGKQALESLGYELTTMTSSVDALDLFKKEPDRFDLVITDMTMPKMTGDELSNELKAIRQDIPVILCTGFSTRITAEKAKDMGIRAFISKPILKQHMAETIRKVLDER